MRHVQPCKLRLNQVPRATNRLLLLVVETEQLLLPTEHGRAGVLLAWNTSCTFGGMLTATSFAFTKVIVARAAEYIVCDTPYCYMVVRKLI